MQNTVTERVRKMSLILAVLTSMGLVSHSSAYLLGLLDGETLMRASIPLFIGVGIHIWMYLSLHAHLPVSLWGITSGVAYLNLVLDDFARDGTTLVGFLFLASVGLLSIVHIYDHTQKRYAYRWWAFDLVCTIVLAIRLPQIDNMNLISLGVGLIGLGILSYQTLRYLYDLQHKNAQHIQEIENLAADQRSLIERIINQAALLEEKNSELIAQTEALEGARRQLDNQLQEAEAARREIEALHAAERQRSAYERFLGRYERLMRESYSLPLEEFLYSLFVYWEEDIGVVGGLLYGVERGELRVLKGFRLGGRERKGQGPLEIMLMSPRVWAVGPLPSGSICLGTSEGGYEPRWAVYVPFVMTGTKELTGLGELYFYEEPSEDTLDKLRDLQERIGMYLWIRRHAGEVLQPQA
ncbi:MAG: hypothetical protein ACUVRD_04665 [Bacteroidia bacterium]